MRTFKTFLLIVLAGMIASSGLDLDFSNKSSYFGTHEINPNVADGIFAIRITDKSDNNESEKDRWSWKEVTTSISYKDLITVEDSTFTDGNKDTKVLSVTPLGSGDVTLNLIYTTKWNPVVKKGITIKIHLH